MKIHRKLPAAATAAVLAALTLTGCSGQADAAPEPAPVVEAQPSPEPAPDEDVLDDDALDEDVLDDEIAQESADDGADSEPEVDDVEPAEDSEPAADDVEAGDSAPAGVITEFTTGDWHVVVHDINPDAADLVLAYSDRLLPPEDGDNWVLANVTVTYNGDKEYESVRAFTATAAFVEHTGATWRAFGGSTGVPDRLNGRLYRGESMTGNVMVIGPSDRVETGYVRFGRVGYAVDVPINS